MAGLVGRYKKPDSMAGFLKASRCVHSSSQQFTAVHSSSQQFTAVHSSSQQFTAVHSSSQQFTAVHAAIKTNLFRAEKPFLLTGGISRMHTNASQPKPVKT
jgi:hypothetical protein